MFGSSIKHSDVICLRIYPASQTRSLNEDRFYVKYQPYIEIEMSQAQFAQAITSLNMGDGTPVTLTSLNGENIEACPYEDKREIFDKEFDFKMQEISDQFKKASQDAEEILENKKTLSKSDRDKITSALSCIRQMFARSIPFMYSQFNRQMEKSAVETKAEIESHIQSRMNDLAMKAMKQKLDYDENEIDDNMLPQNDIEENEDENAGMLMDGM